MLKQRFFTAVIALAVLGVVLFVLPAELARLVILAVVLAGAWEWGGFIGDGLTAGTGDQDMDIATKRAGGGDGVKGGGPQRAVVVFGQDESAHQITFASLRSFSTSSETEPTLTPAARAGGSVTESTFTRGVISTPRSSGVRVSMGFFLAFMMPLSEA